MKAEFETTMSFREMVKISLPMGLTSGAAQVRGSSDLIIIGWLLGPAAAGLYGPIKRVSKQFSLLLPVNKILSPIVASLHAQKNTTELEAVCRKATTYASVMCIPLAIFFFFFGDWFLTVAFGDKYANSGLLLSILILGPLLRAFFSAAGVVLQMTGAQVLTMKVNVLISVVAILLMVAVASPFGLYGIASVSSAAVVVQALMLNYIVYKRMGIRTYTTLFSLKPF
jgi:O-antigen/teichoic acid export membrane protein